MKEKVTVLYTTEGENQIGVGAHLFRLLVTIYDLYPEKVYIDWSANGPYQNPGDLKNIWDLLYEQPDVKELNDNYIIEKRFAHHVFRKAEYTDPSVGNIRDDFLKNAIIYPNDYDRRTAKKLLDEKFRLKEDIKSEIDSLFNNYIKDKKCLAVHRRGCVFSHNNTITDEKFNAGLYEVIKSNDFNSVFLCSDNIMSKNNLASFIQQQGLEVITYDSYLSTNLNLRMPFLDGPISTDRNVLAREVLIEIYLMSMCNAIYRSGSGVSTFVLLLNPDLIEYNVDRNLVYH